MSGGYPVYSHRILYGDTDQMGIVYYANYLRFFEGARNEWIRGLGIAYAEIEARGVMLPVLEAGVRYLRPARYDDLLGIHLDVSHTRVKIRFDYVVKRAGAAGAEPDVLCLGHTIHACVGKDGRPTRAPDWLLAALEPLSKRRKVLEAPIDEALGREREAAE
jgi:acyl-CoA thioester hydrolase